MSTAAQFGEQRQPAGRSGAGRRGGFVPISASPLKQALVFGPMALVSAGIVIGIFLLLMATVYVVGVLVVLAAAALISAGLGLRSA